MVTIWFILVTVASVFEKNDYSVVVEGGVL